MGLISESEAIVLPAVAANYYYHDLRRYYNDCRRRVTVSETVHHNTSFSKGTGMVFKIEQMMNFAEQFRMCS